MTLFRDNRRLGIAVLLSLLFHGLFLLVPEYHQPGRQEKELQVSLLAQASGNQGHQSAATPLSLPLHRHVAQDSSGHVLERVAPVPMKIPGPVVAVHARRKIRRRTLDVPLSRQLENPEPSGVMPTPVLESKMNGSSRLHGSARIQSSAGFGQASERSNHPEPRPLTGTSFAASSPRVDRPPQLLHPVTPSYPSRAREEGIEGTVILELSINRRGRVLAVRIKSADPAGYFESSARKAFLGARFKPALVNGHAVDSKLLQTVHYVLDGVT
ncbi:MAG: TonB family protein [Proteobacteria bacterium]|nr:TonB family protein [Pseudomonadota bacterium]